MSTALTPDGKELLPTEMPCNCEQQCANRIESGIRLSLTDDHWCQCHCHREYYAAKQELATTKTHSIKSVKPRPFFVSMVLHKRTRKVIEELLTAAGYQFSISDYAVIRGYFKLSATVPELSLSEFLEFIQKAAPTHSQTAKERA